MNKAREDYWNSTIAFDCPITNKRHTINDCFKKCDMWGRIYKGHFSNRIVAFLYCKVKYGEPELQNGNPTRDN